MGLLTTKAETGLDSALALAEKLSGAVSIPSTKYDGYARQKNANFSLFLLHNRGCVTMLIKLQTSVDILCSNREISELRKVIFISILLLQYQRMSVRCLYNDCFQFKGLLSLIAVLSMHVCSVSWLERQKQIAEHCSTQKLLPINTFPWKAQHCFASGKQLDFVPFYVFIP